MKLQLLRNATLKLDYAGTTILIDPDFGPKHSRPSFTGRSPNPMVDLPVSPNEILEGVELVIVSHLHADHFDKVAQGLVPKHLPLICQPGDEDTIRSFGFTDVMPLNDGHVMGLTIEAESEPSIYWAGDTILYPPVRETIVTTDPDIIVTHSCGAKWDDLLIVMDAEQTIEACRIAPEHTRIVATHMEALDHATVSRDDLQAYANAHDVAKHKLLIPSDGELLHLTAPNV
jgi:L-ascorbate metabolism protein UlaG (beta-lactamase superfamily)